MKTHVETMLFTPEGSSPCVCLKVTSSHVFIYFRLPLDPFFGLRIQELLVACIVHLRSYSVDDSSREKVVVYYLTSSLLKVVCSYSSHFQEMRYKVLAKRNPVKRSCGRSLLVFKLAAHQV